MKWADPDAGIAWVTGACSGVGRAVALELARRGHKVAATSNAPADLAAIAAEAPERIFAYPADMTNSLDIANVVSRIEAERGPIALAFLNAGGQFQEEQDVFDADLFRRTVDLNLTGTANCIAPLLRAMRARHRGQIALNGSSAGYGGMPEAISYGASKAALIHLAESLRLVCEPDGVTIQLVSLGFVRTPLTDLNRFPMPFLMRPEQAARRICDGFEHGRFEIVVPRRLIWILKTWRLLPYREYFSIVRASTSERARRMPTLKYPDGK